MNEQQTIDAIISRVMVLGIFLACFMLSTQSVRDMLPYDQAFPAYSVGIEILSIVVLATLPKNNLVNGMIDISLYNIFFFVVILESYFLNAALYHWIYDFIYYPYMVMQFLGALLRLAWVWRVDGAWVVRDWPAFGPMAWSVESDPALRPSKREKYYMLSASICCALISLGMSNHGHGWLYSIVGVSMLSYIALYGAKMQTKAVTMAKKSAEYKSIVVSLAESFEGSNDSEHDTNKVVQLFSNDKTDPPK